MFINSTNDLEMIPYWSILDFYVICIVLNVHVWHWFCSF